MFTDVSEEFAVYVYRVEEWDKWYGDRDLKGGKLKQQKCAF
jgi:hypothetical protein